MIGTGSTAIQITSALVDRVEKYCLFQRTAQWIMPGDNPAYTAAERAAFANEPGRLAALREELNHVFIDTISNAVIDADSPAMKAIEAALRRIEESIPLKVNRSSSGQDESESGQRGRNRKDPTEYRQQ